MSQYLSIINSEESLPMMNTLIDILTKNIKSTFDRLETASKSEQEWLIDALK